MHELTLASSQLTNDDLSQLLKHLLSVLREMLASFHQEHHALQEENFSVLESLMESRLNLLIQLDQGKERVMAYKAKMLSLSNDPDLSFQDQVDELHSQLNSEEVELLLFCEQISSLLTEIQTAGLAIQDWLQGKSSKNPYPLVKIKSEPIVQATQLAVMEVE